MNAPPASPAPPRPAFAWLLPAAIALGIAVPIAMLVIARGGLSFPLDDAWIHLQYARNLVAHGAFTYFPGEKTSAGSTAPLFTLLEAGMFALLRNELKTGFALGLLAWAGFLGALAAWARQRTGSAGWAAFAVALVALDGRFGLLAVSGMETSLFLLALALAFLAWSRGHALGAAAAIGAGVWVRPEALMLVGVFAIDGLLDRRRPRALGAGLALLALIVAGYCGFNLVTGGVAFPNTLAAKAAFYKGTPLATFLGGDVAQTFGGGWSIVAALTLLVVVLEIIRIGAEDRSPGVRAELGWALALVLAYTLVLPFSHRFNRYLLPALPSLAVGGAVALAALAARSGAAGKPPGASRWLAPAIAVAVLALQAWHFFPAFEDFRFFARYHLDRHVKAGRWLAEHTPKDAVIGTHDVGAIAYYSQRRIVDMAGLVTPEVIPHIGGRGYLPYLEDLLTRKGVTQLAVLEEWQPVDNARPRFLADPAPERLYVYDWVPGQTHLLDPGLAVEIDSAAAALRRGDMRAATIRVARGINADSMSSRLWLLAGSIRFREGIFFDAADLYARALRRDPGSPQARAGLGASFARMGRLGEARAQLDTLAGMDAPPEWADVLRQAIAQGAAKPSAPSRGAPPANRLKVDTVPPRTR